jgi:hypothetical protein
METPVTLDIPGIRVSRVRGAATDRTPPRPMLPDGNPASQFSWFFKSILSDLDAYYWLVDRSDGFRALGEDSPDSQRITNLLYPDSDDSPSPDATAGRFLHHSRLMTEIAPFVRDDWNSLHGFARLPADPDRVYELRETNERGRDFLPLLDVLLENWDAAFWHLYTRNRSLIERVRADLAGDPTVRVEDAPPLEIEP